MPQRSVSTRMKPACLSAPPRKMRATMRDIISTITEQGQQVATAVEESTGRLAKLSGQLDESFGVQRNKSPQVQRKQPLPYPA